MKVIQRLLCFLSVTTLLCSTLLISIGVIPTYFFAFTPIVISKPLTIKIKAGTSGRKIIKELAKRLNLDKTDFEKFYLVLKISGYDRKLKPGEYKIPLYSTPSDILTQIFKGQVITYTLTIPEGSTIYEIAEKLERLKLAKKEEVLKLVKNPSFIKSLGLEVPSLEGYLFPNTYIFTRHDNLTTIISTMVREFKKRFKPEWVSIAKDMGFTVHQVVTLASIVEKEATRDEERPIIAGVFINRLKIGMPLQSDPTAVYDIPDFKGPIRKSHLQRESPYNTYIIKGLPPSPICNPGLASIKAVLFYKKVPYLYFVSKGDGTHFFSKTYNEHLKYIQIFRTHKKSIHTSPNSKEEKADGNSQHNTGSRQRIANDGLQRQ